VAIDDLSDKLLKELMDFYVKYRVEYGFMKVSFWQYGHTHTHTHTHEEYTRTHTYRKRTWRRLTSLSSTSCARTHRGPWAMSRTFSRITCPCESVTQVRSREKHCGHAADTHEVDGAMPLSVISRCACAFSEID